MKKTLVLFLIITLSCSIYAQQKTVRKPAPIPIQLKPKPTDKWFGIFAGPNLNYLSYTDKTTTIKGHNTSFHAGIFFQKKINKQFALQPALLFAIRGGEISNVDSNINAMLMNIEVPINFLYLYKRLIIGGGPNFSYGINGIFKSNGTTKNAYEADESFERTLKPFEFGANFLIGYTFKKGILITANFAPGLTNIYKGDGSAPPDLKAHTSMLGISIGYMFAIVNNE
jgi:hypothetical protein